MISDKEIVTPYVTIKPGHVAGLKSSAYATMDRRMVIELDFESHADVKEEFDMVEIIGIPNIKEVIHGGIYGDIGTAAIIVNSITKVINAKSGLTTMLDLPIPSAVQ